MSIRNRILEIVVFLMDYIRDDNERQSEADDVSMALKTLGYSENEIGAAYTWFLDQFKGTPEQYFSQFPQNQSSLRVLTTSERASITPEALGLLMKLLSTSVINAEQLESIIERATFFAAEPITLEQMKIIASSVVFHETDDHERPGFVGSADDQIHLVN